MEGTVTLLLLLLLLLLLWLSSTSLVVVLLCGCCSVVGGVEGKGRILKRGFAVLLREGSEKGFPELLLLLLLLLLLSGVSYSLATGEEV